MNQARVLVPTIAAACITVFGYSEKATDPTAETLRSRSVTAPSSFAQPASEAGAPLRPVAGICAAFTNADGMAICACQNGALLHFTTLDNMIRSLAVADRVGKLDAKLRTYTTKSQLLVVDEVGYLPLTRAEANYLFQVVSSCYERSSVILTSNKSVTEWPEVFGDHAIATAILDRLLHHSTVLSIKGNSYRLRERAIAATRTPEPQPVPAA